jgi:hypothetical protein
MIFENLINLASSSRPILRQWHLEQMGLDPQHDCDFIIDIIHSHDIPIKVDYLKLDTTSPTGCG